MTDQYANIPSPPQPEQLLYEWQAPDRPHTPRNRQYYSTIAIIVFLVCLILLFAGQFLPIAVVISLAFLAYVLSAVPPEQRQHQLTTYGIRTDQQLYYWQELGRFWLEQSQGFKLLAIEVGRFPYRLNLIVDQNQYQEVKKIFSQILLEEQPPLTGIEKAASWLKTKVKLEPDQSPSASSTSSAPVSQPPSTQS